MKGVEVYKWMQKATMDVIGLAGFGTAFNTLKGTTNKRRTLYKERICLPSCSSIRMHIVHFTYLLLAMILFKICTFVGEC